MLTFELLYGKSFNKNIIQRNVNGTFVYLNAIIVPTEHLLLYQVGVEQLEFLFHDFSGALQKYNTTIENLLTNQ